jgi:hypothetical protein
MKEQKEQTEAVASGTARLLLSTLISKVLCDAKKINPCGDFL